MINDHRVHRFPEFGLTYLYIQCIPLTYLFALFTPAFLCLVYRSPPSRERMKRPRPWLKGHVLRWILLFLLILCSLVSIAEAVHLTMINVTTIVPEQFDHTLSPAGVITLTSVPPNHTPFDKYTYSTSVDPITRDIVDCIMTVATLLALAILSFFYVMCEELEITESYLWSPIVYWLLGAIADVVRLYVMLEWEVTGQYVRFYVTIASLTLYATFIVLDIITLATGNNDDTDTDPDANAPLRGVHGEPLVYVHEQVSLVSRLTWSWMWSLMTAGYRRPLDAQDLGRIPECDSVELHHKNLQKEYEMNQKSSSRWRRSLLFACLRVYRSQICVSGAYALIYLVLQMTSAMMINPIVNYVVVSVSSTPNHRPHYNNSTGDILIHLKMSAVTLTHFLSNGFVLSLLMFGLQCLGTAFLYHYYFVTSREGLRCKAAIQSMIYAKTLRLSQDTNSDCMSSVNLMSTDPLNIYTLFRMGHMLWSAPLTVLIGFYLLFVNTGVSALFGASILLLVLPCQFFIARRLTLIRKRVMMYADERLAYCTELLTHMKLIRMYSWLDVFLVRITEARRNELKQLFTSAVVNTITIMICNGIPILACYGLFCSYTIIHGELLSTPRIFSTLAILHIIGTPLYYIPITIDALINANVSSGRLEKFLSLPEISSAPIVDINKGNIEISLNNASFSWNDKPTIKNISLEIPAAKVTMVLGRIGSGKSSLLSAVLGEMELTQGSIRFKSGQPSMISYASQQAWLQNATIRDNVVFGSTFDPDRFTRVISACALDDDLADLPSGDLCEIGEKGATLSGGQKQRVNLARVLYSNSQIVVLDDPLSALDANVRTQVMNHAILKFLVQSERRTVIMVTHSADLLTAADKVIIMRDGTIAQEGVPSTISYEAGDVSDRLNVVSQSNRSPSSVDVKHFNFLDPGHDSYRLSAASSLMSMGSTMAINDPACLTGEGDLIVRADKLADEKRLMPTEERERGNTPLRVYLTYVGFAGLNLVCGVVALYSFKHLVVLGNEVWLTWWSKQRPQRSGNEVNVGAFVGGYTGIVICAIAMIGVTQMVFQITCLKASRILHSKLINSLVAAPIRFFDTTPVARILNRLSSDMKIIDVNMVTTLETLLYDALYIIGTVVISAVLSPAFLVVILPLLVLFLFMQRFFIATSRELQRLDSITKSPILTHFNDTLSGLFTIRAYKQQDRFMGTNNKRIDENNKTFLFLQTASIWIGFRLQIIGAVTSLIGTICVLVSGLSGYIDPAYVGFNIVHIMVLSMLLAGIMRSLSDCELWFTSVERYSQYMTLDPEQDTIKQSLSPDWPKRGEIVFEDVNIRYYESQSPVIKNFTFSISAGEKIGICGRTGSGKSSLMLSLFRLVNYTGNIRIDGMELKRIELSQLRSKLSIIPQDPILFRGSIRFNLDPTNEKSDILIWKTLEITLLKELVESLPAGLDEQVYEGGDLLFSVGQKQLLCLTRAILRDTKILIMDEATASVDAETDAICQRVIEQTFKGRTIITIAHRVSTIMNMDKILVISRGEMIECGTVDELLDARGAFASMALRKE